jgi:hypothetical protein
MLYHASQGNFSGKQKKGGELAGNGKEPTSMNISQLPKKKGAEAKV